MKILLIEDEDFNLIVLEEMVKICCPDAQIMTATNGQLAYEDLARKLF